MTDADFDKKEWACGFVELGSTRGLFRETRGDNLDPYIYKSSYLRRNQLEDNLVALKIIGSRYVNTSHHELRFVFSTLSLKFGFWSIRRILSKRKEHLVVDEATTDEDDDANGVESSRNMAPATCIEVSMDVAMLEFLVVNPEGGGIGENS
ncbi:hypothetical protein R6Q57_011542 [Mikania cordata]